MKNSASVDDNDDDDDDDDDDEELFLGYVWPTKGVYALFPGRTIVRDSHHCNSPTCCKQGLSPDFVE